MADPTTDLKAQIAKYRWYHSIEVAPGIVTPGEPFDSIWNFIEKQMMKLDFTDKRVLDIGCRDGKFSILAEKLGARGVVAVDNDLSRGATEFLLPHLGSRVTMLERNLMAMTLDKFHDAFDTILMLGVLYHLRYPMLGLRRAVNLLKPGGTMLIEGGMLKSENQNIPLLFCPWKEMQPYEPGSPTYFNPKGLATVLLSMGCTEISCDWLKGSEVTKDGVTVCRCAMVFKKTHDMPDHLREYWEEVHIAHTGPQADMVRNPR